VGILIRIGGIEEFQFVSIVAPIFHPEVKCDPLDNEALAYQKRNLIGYQNPGVGGNAGTETAQAN
jgi:hypothetical protein